MDENQIHSDGTAPQNPGKKKKALWIVLAAVLVLVGAVAAFILLRPQEEIPAPTEPSAEAPTEPVTEAPTEPQMLPHMAELYAQNPDIVGWIRVEGTKLDYPVMHTPEDEQKYIRMDFEGKTDLAGLPFISQDCTMDPESQNLVIYGHNMKNGTGFKTIYKFLEEDFREEHPTIYFSTLYEERTYEVLSVFYDRVYKQADTNFKFYHFIDPATAEEFDEGIDYFHKNCVYDSEVDAEYGDSLITLVTCSYHVRRGRLVLVAREVTEPLEAATETVNP